MLKVILAVSTTLVATTALADAKKDFVATDNSIETRICVTAANGTVPQMNKAVRSIRPRAATSTLYRLVANKLSCNGYNVGDWAMQAGNLPVANKINSYRNTRVEIIDIAAR
ncbi:DUF3718 domain-containing protein [Paraferrimonas sp. SM1919]|uniref:DUF3718 domain-containing protein n=1 Tax=Paraferrimonas sp. SM1919 TaxID=2662263 RepID=UPI0013D1E41A|nr:DUF3718 domain-containing protein [Paraferrimonas sp. SM1919]